MYRLLEEQFLLCSQLCLPGTQVSSLSPSHRGAIIPQCCLLPWLTSSDMWNNYISSWNMDSSGQSHPKDSLGCSPTKAEKLNIVDFIRRVRRWFYWSTGIIFRASTILLISASFGLHPNGAFTVNEASVASEATQIKRLMHLKHLGQCKWSWKTKLQAALHHNIQLVTSLSQCHWCPSDIASLVAWTSLGHQCLLTAVT